METENKGGKEMKITKEILTEWNACKEGLEAFKAQTETDGIKIIEAIIKTGDDEKIEWGNWLIVRMMDKKQKIQYAVFAAEQVLEIFEKKYPEDKRPRKAIEAAKKCIENDTEENYIAARVVASDAAWAARAACDAARAASAAMVAASDAAMAAASAAWVAWVAWVASDAASDAACDVASEASALALKVKIMEYGISLLRGGK